MLKIDNHNVNFSGQSMLEDAILANFNASFYGANDINTSATIMNYDLSEEAKETLLADIAAFYSEVIEKVAMLADKGEEEVSAEEETSAEELNPVEE